MTESEIKLRVEDPAVARKAVLRLGATLRTPRHLEDNLVLDDPGASLAASGRLLRLRRTPAGALLTYKGPARIEEGIRSRPELETAIGSVHVVQTMLEGLGLQVVFRYQKYREAYAWKDVEIVVDETPFGFFLEVEGTLRSVHEAAAALGYGPADYITDSYAALFFASGGTGDMVFK